MFSSQVRKRLDVFPPRHALLHRSPPSNRDEHHIRLALLDGADDFGKQRGIVLIIRVDHHDDIGAGVQRLAVAGLLVGAVAVVAVVNEQLQAQFARDAGGFVFAAVVDQDHQVHHVVRQVGIGHVQRSWRRCRPA